MTDKALVLLSGGLDSAVSLYWAISQQWETRTFELDYFRRPERERNACAALRDHAGIGSGESIVLPVDFLREVVDIPKHIPIGSRLLQSPRGYIPARNLVFYSLCLHYAEIFGIRYVVGGHNRKDSEAFPDAGTGFFRQLNAMLPSTLWSYAEIQTEILLPLIDYGKSEVVQLGHGLGVPFEMTWSCYSDGESPCRTCKSCAERGKAFEDAGLNDPLNR